MNKPRGSGSSGIGSGLLTALAGVVFGLIGLGPALADEPALDVRVRHTLKPFEVKRLSTGFLALSPDGQTLAYLGGGGKALWDLKTGKNLLDIKKTFTFGGRAVFRSDGKSLISGQTDRLQVWDIATGKQIDEWKGTVKEILDIKINRDGTLVAVTSGKGTVHLLDAKTGEEFAKLDGHGGLIVPSAAFSPDGKTLVSGGYDKTARLWDVATRKQLAVFKGHTSTVDAVAFSPDGKTIATGGHDRTVRLWDVAKRKERATLKGPVNGPLTALAFSPDGKFLASGGRGGEVFDPLAEITLWNPATGKKLATVNAEGSRANTIVISPDSSIMATVCSDGQLVVWDVRAK